MERCLFTTKVTTTHTTRVATPATALVMTTIAFIIAILGLLCVTPVSADEFRARLNQVVGNKTQSEDVIAEIRFGRKIAARILGREKLYDNTTLTRYISLIGNSIVQHSSRNELQYHFAILDQAYPNAYSTPGGYVFITKGAIDAAQDEAELAGVLAHEVAHVSLRHIVKDLSIHATDNSSLSGISRILGGFSSTTRVALNQTVNRAMRILFSKGFNHQEELEADQTATLMLAETGYDPTALRRYLQHISASSHPADEIQTHPATPERLQALDKLLAAEGLDKSNFPTVKIRFDKMTGHTP